MLQPPTPRIRPAKVANRGAATRFYIRFSFATGPPPTKVLSSKLSTTACRLSTVERTAAVSTASGRGDEVSPHATNKSAPIAQSSRATRRKRKKRGTEGIAVHKLKSEPLDVQISQIEASITPRRSRCGYDRHSRS